MLIPVRHENMEGRRSPVISIALVLNLVVFLDTHGQPGTWREAHSPNRDVADAWDARIGLIEDPAALEQEMDSLAGQFSSAEQSSVLEQCAFQRDHLKPIAYLTATFLHGGSLHLIGNIWFLWLAGAILEDFCGPAIYPWCRKTSPFRARIHI